MKRVELLSDVAVMAVESFVKGFRWVGIDGDGTVCFTKTKGECKVRSVNEPMTLLRFIGDGILEDFSDRESAMKAISKAIRLSWRVEKYSVNIEAMRAINLTLTELASGTGVTKQYLSQVLCGHTPATDKITERVLSSCNGKKKEERC